MLDVARWYLATLLIGVAGVLPATLVFGRFYSGGVLYGRALGALVVAYVAWIVGTTALGYGAEAVLLGVAVLVGWSAFLAVRRPALLEELLGRWRFALAGEAVFLLVFALALLARSLVPAATNTEKPMDLMILMAIHEAQSMPPEDSWYAGQALSYYHLGHTAVDVISRLSGVAPSIAFNLGLASAGAMAAAAIFALGADVYSLTTRRAARPWLAGGVAAFALVGLGSLEGGLELVAANLGGSWWSTLGVTGFPSGQVTLGVPTDFWWWWRATRVLPDAISEFPGFSLLLGDLHAHVLNLPLAVLAVGVAATAFGGTRPQTLQVWMRRPGELLVIALIFAGIAMTNSWDAPLYGVVWLGAGLFAYAVSGWGFFGSVIGMARHMAPPAGLALVLAWPMLSTFQHVPVGVVSVLSAGSDLPRFALFWGPLLAILGVCVAISRPRGNWGASGIAALYATALVVAWAMALASSDNSAALVERGIGWLTLVVLIAVLAWSVGAAVEAARDGDRARGAWLALVAGAASIFLVTELFHLADALPGRFNTVFKFWYGAWLLLALASGVAVSDVITNAKEVTLGIASRAAAGGALVLVALCALYIPAAILARGTEGQVRGLDALAYLRNDGRDDFATVEWASTLGPDAVLVEAVGQPYRGGNPISMASGVPTVLGWNGHEVTWRGDGAAVGARERDVATLYAEGASAKGLEVARRYGVTHVHLGAREREKYGATVADRFSGWRVAFETPTSRVVAVPTSDTP